MAGISDMDTGPLTGDALESVKTLLWGPDIKNDIFRRWTQGIVFSDDEPSALVQYEGGPCAVIAPIQAFILKNAIFSRSGKYDLHSITKAEQDSLLCLALADMLSLVSTRDAMLLVEHDSSAPPRPPRIPTNPPSRPSVENEGSIVDSNKITGDSPTGQSVDNELNIPVSDSGPQPHSSPDPTTACTASKKKRLSHEEFHSGLRWRSCNTCDVLNQLKLNLQSLRGEYGVLLILYSIVLTKGVEHIKNEVEDLLESLIAGIFGHGSQSLINLLITGRAVNNVWDNDKVVSGLKLHGINKQATIGFLTQLEHLRYCEVGWYLKNPEYPIWLLGSETHLTVLFSTERSLVVMESPETIARRVFARFDAEGCGFVAAEKLGDLMGTLDLVSDPEYVSVMEDKLDPEKLGIITLNSFMEEFFPFEGQGRADLIQSFSLWHYNGQPRSCPNNKVVYATGRAELQEIPELQIITDSSMMKTCLMTKWPTLELQWKNNVIPSLQ